MTRICKHKWYEQQSACLEMFTKKVILEKTGKIKKGKKLSIEERIKKDFELFDRVGRSGLQIDLVKALRKDRDRDNA